MSKDPRVSKAEELIEVCPDFPKPGISFKYVLSFDKNVTAERFLRAT